MRLQPSSRDIIKNEWKDLIIALMFKGIKQAVTIRAGILAHDNNNEQQQRVNVSF